MCSPFFTVVIPTYNRADLLPLSIQSVLNQTFQDFEVVVVDNCSTDNTSQVMKQYTNDSRVRYFRNEQNMERGFSRNVGFHNGDGEFLTLLDSDDLMYENCLLDGYDYIQQNLEVKVFHNLYEMIDETGRPTKRKKFMPIRNQYKQLCQGNFLSCIGIFLNKEVYKKFFFTEDLKMIGSEDYEIWFRILAHYKVGRIEKVNCGIREHVGRSVYSSMYENLEYQRKELNQLIDNDAVLKERYGKYWGYVDANYYFHEAMYSLHKKEKETARKQFLQAATKGNGFVFSKRFLAFIKNYLFKA